MSAELESNWHSSRKSDEDEDDSVDRRAEQCNAMPWGFLECVLLSSSKNSEGVLQCCSVGSDESVKLSSVY